MRLQEAFRDIIAEHAQDLMRYKGIASIAGLGHRLVFQGVHMLFDGRPDRPWGKNPRRNQLIFIGRNLNRTELNEAFKQCLV